MGITIAPYVEADEPRLEIDNRAAMYNLYRFDNESLLSFKDRFLTNFIYPPSQSMQGYANAIAYALGMYPKVVGYLVTTDPEIKVTHDGQLLVVESMGEDGQATRLATINLFENYSFEMIEEILSEFNVTFVISDNKYKTKDFRFFKPFSTEITRLNTTVYPGLNDLGITLGISIDESTFVSKSPLFQNKVNSPESLVSLGDYYYNPANGTLIVYDDGKNFGSIQIAYRRQWEYLAIFYTPVSVSSLDVIKNNLQENKPVAVQEDLGGGSYSYTVANEFTSDMLNKEALSLFWDAFVQNQLIWKANQNHAVGIGGIYYAK
jgi:hypothetical protein